MSENPNDPEATRAGPLPRATPAKGAAGHRPGLRFVDGPLAGSEVIFGKAAVVVGRDSAQCDVVLDDASVSRRHAVFRTNGTSCRVVDMGSRNGTKVNGAPVTECDVKYGDVIEIGSLRVKLTVEDAASAGPGKLWVVG